MAGDRTANGTQRSAEDPPREPPWFRAEFIALVIAVLCYVNTLSNDFCDDGVPLVQLNPLVNDSGQWGTIWTTDQWFQLKNATPNRDLLYRPVALTSYRIVRTLAGPGPFPQLLANILLHALNTLLVVRLCRHAKGGYAATLAAGVLFAVLPIHTEVIANVVGRADLLATMGMLTGVLWHRRSMIATTAGRIIKWRIAAAIAVFIAMGAKESGVTAAVLIVLLDGLWYQPWRAASHDRSWWNRRSLLRFTYLLIPAGAYFALRYFALEGQLFQRPALTKTVNVLVDAPPWQHVLGTLQLWAMYWVKMVWPRILSVNYSINAIRLATSPWDTYVLTGVLVAVMLVVGSVWAWRRNVRSVAYLSAALAISYAPTSNALVLIQVFFAERIWYLPSIWVAVLAGLALGRFKRKPLWYAVGTIMVFAMTARCWVRNAEWRDNRTLYAATYNAHRQGVGALRLEGQELLNEGRVEEGIKLLEEAVQIDLGFTDAQRSLGHAYLLVGDFARALRHLQIANMQIPDHPPTLEALRFARRALAGAQRDEMQSARKRVADNPHDVQAAIALVKKLRELDQLPEALSLLQKHEADFSENVAWQSEYAVTLVYQNQIDRAIDRYHQALLLAPEDPSLLVELAMLLAERRKGEDLDQAAVLSARALRIHPQAPKALVCRAEVLALKGNLGEAVELYDRAIRLLPPGNSQRRIWEARARALGQ